ATEVEDHAVVTGEINTGAKLPLDLVRGLPVRLAGNSEPDADRSLGLRVTLPEFLQRSPGNPLHRDGLDIMSPIWGQEIEFHEAANGRRTNHLGHVWLLRRQSREAHHLLPHPGFLGGKRLGFRRRAEQNAATSREKALLHRLLADD